MIGSILILTTYYKRNSRGLERIETDEYVDVSEGVCDVLVMQ